MSDAEILHGPMTCECGNYTFQFWIDTDLEPFVSCDECGRISGVIGRSGDKHRGKNIKEMES